MKGHPLLWGAEAGVPPWSQGQPSPELQRLRVTEIMQRYQGKIELWEVVNEPAHVAEPKIDQPYRWAREAVPEACLIVNDYHVLADGCPAFFQLLTEAQRNDVPFDGIGIQAHEPRTMRFPLDRVLEILDQYATFGKGLHITEFTPTSSGQAITGSHHDGRSIRLYNLQIRNASIVAVHSTVKCLDEVASGRSVTPLATGLLSAESREATQMRIFLAGVSCVGKTTVGAHLAALRGVPFFDLDIEVEQFFQRPIAQIQAECLTMDS